VGRARRSPPRKKGQAKWRAGLRNKRRGAGNGDAEVEEVTVVKVAPKVELDIALCMDPRGRLREGGKECSLLGADALEGCESDQIVRARWWLRRQPPQQKGPYGVLTYSRSLSAQINDTSSEMNWTMARWARFVAFRGLSSCIDSRQLADCSSSSSLSSLSILFGDVTCKKKYGKHGGNVRGLSIMGIPSAKVGHPN